jgi:hypothetical protein
MAQKQDKDDAGKPKPSIPPASPPSGKPGVPPRNPAPETFLPEDSFLLDLEDDKSQRSAAPAADPKLPAQGGGEEWLLVDDSELVAPEAAQSEPLPMLEPVGAAAPIEPAPETSEKKVPSWYTDDEGALPKFVSESDEAAASAASAAATTAVEEEPVAPEAEAPVVELSTARRRRMLAAAAGFVALLGLGGGAWFWMNRGGDVEPVEVAHAPRPTPTPAPKPAPEPTVAAPQPTPEPEPAPVVPEPSPTVEAPPVELEPQPARPETAPAPEPVVVDGPPKRPLPLIGSGRPAPATKKGDTILQLKNGHTFRGQITRTKGTLVTMRIGQGECVFDLDEVTLLDSSAPEYRRADQMPEASVVLTTGQHLRGRLMKQTEENVVLVVNNGQVVFPRSDIRGVTFTGRIHF